MSEQTPDLSNPIFDTQLTSELGRTFRGLFGEIEDLFNIHHNDESVTAAAAALHQSLQKEVLAQPILARTISKHFLGWSLLEILCRKTYHSCEESIKFLIEQNPHALLWKPMDKASFGSSAPIHLIAESQWYCELLPWIAEHHLWVFQHQSCQKKPPHLGLVRSYVNGSCGPGTIRRFYELYPQGLKEKDRDKWRGGYPLSMILEGPEEADADTFIWMAQQYPDAVYHKKPYGGNLLHRVCDSLAMTENEFEYAPVQCTPNMAKICRFLISEHPDLVRGKMKRSRYLPIHMLVYRCNRPIVQEIAILLLKAYPKCVNVVAESLHPALCTVPFVQEVLPLILEELEIDREILQLVELSQNMSEALSRKHRIQGRIAEICRALEGEDLGDEEEEYWNEDHDSDDAMSFGLSDNSEEEDDVEDDEEMIYMMGGFGDDGNSDSCSDGSYY